MLFRSRRFQEKYPYYTPPKRKGRGLLLGLIAGGLVVVLALVLLILLPQKKNPGTTTTVPMATATPTPTPPPSLFSFADVPPYNGELCVTLNGNIPFDDLELPEAWISLSPLDALGRCDTAVALLGPETLPTEERGPIGTVTPSGWHTASYPEQIPDRYLYNRCHLIGYQLCGLNDNPLNLITGTRYLNVSGMLPYENDVQSYIERSGNHVLYRVTPVFIGEELVARGVLMEAVSLEDNALCFCVFVYNVQPGIVIDYASGESAAESR